MTELGYPDIAQHKAEHAKILQEFEVRAAAIGKGEPTAKLIMFLWKWIIEHVQVTDKQLGDFVASLPNKPGN